MFPEIDTGSEQFMHAESSRWLIIVITADPFVPSSHWSLRFAQEKKRGRERSIPRFQFTLFPRRSFVRGLRALRLPWGTKANSSPSDRIKASFACFFSGEEENYFRTAMYTTFQRRNWKGNSRVLCSRHLPLSLRIMPHTMGSYRFTETRQQFAKRKHPVNRHLSRRRVET